MSPRPTYSPTRGLRDVLRDAKVGREIARACVSSGTTDGCLGSACEVQTVGPDLAEFA
jgi:hypothetical protein